MIVAQNVSRSFGARGFRRHTVTPLRDVSHVFPDGAVTCVVGLNGTGKSTLLRILAGVLCPDAGEVTIRGSRGGTCGMLLDVNAVNSGHTGRRHLRWVATARGLPRSVADRAVVAAGLTQVADSPVKGWSLGMRQRLGIATALLGEPDNVVLDEPLNGLDVAGMLWLRSVLWDLADAGRCVIVASHHLSEVEACADEVVVLESGGIRAAGDVDEVRGGHRNLEAAFTALVPRAREHEVRR